MSGRFDKVLLLVFFTLGLGNSMVAQAQDAKKCAETPTSAQVAAVVGATSITVGELEELSQGRLIRLRSEEYSLRQRVLEEAIAQRLLEREAQARGISLAELTRVEIEARVAPITEAEKQAAFAVISEQSPSQSEAEVLKQAETSLRQKRLNDRRQELLKSLREKAGVRVMLDPPRLKVEAGDAPAKGPRNAPVTIVEFSEFQCPYCSKVTDTLKQLQAHYGDKLRLAFRHFPLPMHKEALKASEATFCASEQGKFWELHDELFKNQRNLQVAELKQYAANLNLNTAQFNQCLDSGKYTEKVQADRADGARYGISGTPAFFINGRLLVGAVPYENFARLIDEELERAGVPKPAPRAATAPTLPGSTQ